MKIRFGLLLLMSSVTLCTSGSEVRAEDPKAKADLPKALQPEVQTAAWAVKWWKPRHEEKLKQKAAMKQVDLLMIGDSITHGWEGAGKEVFANYYGKRKTLNLGFSGDRTEHVLWRLQHGAVDDISPKLAIVMIGTNNTGHRKDPPKETAAGVKAIIDELQKRLPETKILLLAIFPRGVNHDDGLRKINQGVNKLIHGFADAKKIYYLDINNEFLDDDGTLPKKKMPDLLHPNAQGYEIWAYAMEPLVANLLGEEKESVEE